MTSWLALWRLKSPALLGMADIEVHINHVIITFTLESYLWHTLRTKSEANLFRKYEEQHQYSICISAQVSSLSHLVYWIDRYGWKPNHGAVRYMHRLIEDFLMGWGTLRLQETHMNSEGWSLTHLPQCCICLSVNYRFSIGSDNCLSPLWHKVI